MRDFLSRDKEQNLKVVTAGIKVLERMAGKGKGSKADDEYRLVQVRTHYYETSVISIIQYDGKSLNAIPASFPYTTVFPFK